MKVLVFLALAALANARSFEDVSDMNTAYGYYSKIGIPLAEEIRQAEAAADQSRIVGGSASELGQFPYQAGLLATLPGGTGVCGGSLINPARVITAAHCWFDGVNQASELLVVLGSITLFSGGTRITSNNVIMHPNWIPILVRNDVAMIYLTNTVPFSTTISPIALPSVSDEDFAGESAIASGFGLTSDNGAVSQFLNHVNLEIISNTVCWLTFPLYIQNSNICTSGAGAMSTCRGDSGGPLAVTKNNKPLLVGITSFGSPRGCQANQPAAYARVSSYMNFINQHL